MRACTRRHCHRPLGFRDASPTLALCPFTHLQLPLPLHLTPHTPITEPGFPGPGAYDPNIKYTRGSRVEPPAYSMGRKAPSSFEDHEGTPGPGHYTVGGTIGRVGILQTIPAASAFTMKPLRPIKTANLSPGPAAYGVGMMGVGSNPGPGGKGGERGGALPPAPGYGKGVKLPVFPGPNQYTPKPVNAKASPQFSFRIKHSDYEYFIQDGNKETEFTF